MSNKTTEKKRRRRLGDRSDGRRLRTLDPITRVACYVMSTRTGSSNRIRDKAEISNAEKYIREKKAQGFKNFTLMHVILTAYLRVVSQMPAVNRFIAGHRIFARNGVEVALTVKKEMTLSSPESVVKIFPDPSMTCEDVYNLIQAEIEGYRNEKDNSLDSLIKILNYIPGFILRGVVGLLRGLDYVGLLPRALTKLSPFHCSIYITSMGSLGIPPVHHHLYEFGNCPVFLAFGAKERKYELNADGEVEKKEYVEYTVNLDERICDGFYFAAALKKMRRYIKDPWQLDNPPETVIEDVD